MQLVEGGGGELSYPLMVWGHCVKTTDLKWRERLYLSAELLEEANSQVHGIDGVLGCCILSTCNRTEYLLGLEQGADEAAILATLSQQVAQRSGLTREEVMRSCFVERGPEAFKHMIRVASGMESKVLGEPQILGQFRAARALAEAQGTLNTELDEALQAALRTARDIRTHTALGAHPVSIASVAVKMCEKILPLTLKNVRVAIAGMGEMGMLVMRQLASAGVDSFVLSSRFHRSSLEMPRAEHILLPELVDRLHEFDLVICSTASEIPVIGLGAVVDALHRRRNRPITFIDLAVPRDVERAVDKLPDAFVFDLDSLVEESSAGYQERREAAVQAESLVEQGMEAFRELQAKRNITPFLQQIREIGEKRAEELIAQAGRSASADEREALNKLGHALTGSLLHLSLEVARRLGHGMSAEERVAFLEDLLSRSRSLSLHNVSGSGGRTEERG